MDRTGTGTGAIRTKIGNKIFNDLAATSKRNFVAAATFGARHLSLLGKASSNDSLSVDDNLPSAPVLTVSPTTIPRIAEAPSEEQFVQDNEVEEQFLEDEEVQEEFLEDEEVQEEFLEDEEVQEEFLEDEEVQEEFLEDEEVQEEFLEDEEVQEEFLEDDEVQDRFSVDDHLPSAPVLTVNPITIPRVPEVLSKDQLLFLRNEARENPVYLEDKMSILFFSKEENSWVAESLVRANQECDYREFMEAARPMNECSSYNFVL